MKYEYVDVKLGEFSYRLIALVFELGDLDMVLGIKWLKTLGDTTRNRTLGHDHQPSPNQ